MLTNNEKREKNKITMRVGAAARSAARSASRWASAAAAATRLASYHSAAASRAARITVGSLTMLVVVVVVVVVVMSPLGPDIVVRVLLVEAVLEDASGIACAALYDSSLRAKARSGAKGR